VFTLLLNEQPKILLELLELYFPARRKVKVIDLTFGRGALWSIILQNATLRSKYQLTACDASPDSNAVAGVQAIRKNLFTDDYTALGLHDAAVFDPPYLVERLSFDYEQASKKSWSANNLERHTSNPNVAFFNRRVEALKQKASTFLKPGGLLLIKIMDPRKDGTLITHHINIANILNDSCELVDLAVYTRMGATTWKINGHLQNLHGYWMTFKLRKSVRCVKVQDVFS